MITAVVFDLDDTLYDEADYCRSGFQAVARFLVRFSTNACADDVFACLWGHFTAGNRTRTFNAALEELAIAPDEDLIRQLVELYRTHRPALTLPPDSRDVLEALKERYTLALLTDGFLPAQRLKVEALGIAAYFKTIVYTEELGRACWKPSPVGFERLIETLDIAPERMAYVGDNETKDFIAPNRLGMLTIQVRCPASLHTESSDHPDAPPRLRTDDIRRLPPLLARY
ncbi:MAG: HAD family hydrolase [Planctomycetota bacterium]|jgi:putative hydrolase of the HAD superfamily